MSCWPLQTRPFLIATPGVYREYRLRLQTPTRTQWAEIELPGPRPEKP
ncbi:alpha-mannosidase [Xanthomonas oryzae pv. leersiae]|uniref:Alpha-mannosidase n=1 Tax=Xanthomonas oryzae pv. leersiae TaxID=3112258 RepID=A0AAJ6KHL2_9XANT|nr:alpha-mannosidase [Xanthomonas oryzae]WIX06046.1 alpha-mannosidase [Xanthomonas oryzae pv. oryzae]